MHPALEAMLTETVAHSRYAGQDSYGMPAYAPVLTRPARVEHHTQQITNRSGQEVTSRTRVFLAPAPPIGHRDKLTLEDGTSPTIQDVIPVKDQRGVLQHWEIML